MTYHSKTLQNVVAELHKLHFFIDFIPAESLSYFKVKTINRGVEYVWANTYPLYKLTEVLTRAYFHFHEKKGLGSPKEYNKNVSIPPGTFFLNAISYDNYPDGAKIFTEDFFTEKWVFSEGYAKSKLDSVYESLEKAQLLGHIDGWIEKNKPPFIKEINEMILKHEQQQQQQQQQQQFRA